MKIITMNFEHLKQIRRNFIGLLDGLSLEQLNQKPEGFNNTIIWNYGHLIVTQQLLCYRLSGNELLISNELVEEFKKGAAPSRDVTESELVSLKQFGVSLIDQMEEDYKAGKLDSFKPYTTSFKVELNSIEETITFLSVHEALHLGYAMAQRKLLI